MVNWRFRIIAHQGQPALPDIARREVIKLLELPAIHILPEGKVHHFGIRIETRCRLCRIQNLLMQHKTRSFHGCDDMF